MNILITILDNCLIDVDAPEFPIMDGSSISFIQKILETGTITQNAKKIYLSFPRKKIKVKDEISGASLTLTPNESFSIKSNISFGTIETTRSIFARLIFFRKRFCFCKNFCFRSGN
ncbi:UDP-3-O-acyl-N-acetylglucosamine deacetylase [Dysgonomonas capnocytophagoides]|uniref:UDP-3-O-acyl-N-acetylglucosamine deacetylase n=1 Tax=Dysgonomonas capnocytophagoides TaxID=45254 RepID=UPI0033418877